MQYLFEIVNSGAIVEKTMTVAQMLASKRGDDLHSIEEGTARRRIDLEHGGFRNSHAGWPLLDDAAGCQPKQIAENVEYLRSAGVPTDFTRDGRVIWRDRNHRKRGLKALGLKDLDGGYGD